MAEELGLDMSAFNQCMDEDVPMDEIDAMQQEARQLGIESTPAVVLDGEALPYQGYADLKAKIDAQLDAE